MRSVRKKGQRRARQSAARTGGKPKKNKWFTVMKNTNFFSLPHYQPLVPPSCLPLPCAMSLRGVAPKQIKGKLRNLSFLSSFPSTLAPPPPLPLSPLLPWRRYLPFRLPSDFLSNLPFLPPLCVCESRSLSL